MRIHACLCIAAPVPLIAIATYTLALPLWFGTWWWIGGFRMQRQDPMLWLPNGLCLLFLLINLVPVSVFGEVGAVAYEEGLFLCVAGIIVLLRDIMATGDIELYALAYRQCHAGQQEHPHEYEGMRH